MRKITFRTAPSLFYLMESKIVIKAIRENNFREILLRRRFSELFDENDKADDHQHRKDGGKKQSRF